MTKAKLFNSGKLSRETILSQAALEVRKVQRPSRKGVGPSGPKQELPHVGNDMVFSAWRHAADGLAVESGLASRVENQVGFIAYDRDLIRILDEPDPEWASLKSDNPYKIKQARVSFSDPTESGIPSDKQNPDYIMNAWQSGKNLGPVTEEMLARNADGSVKHSSFDIHWSIAERIYEDGRELMDADIQRSAGKVITKKLVTRWSDPVTTTPLIAGTSSTRTISSQTSSLGLSEVQRLDRKVVDSSESKRGALALAR